MKGGTYAEALTVGFTPEQGGFFARFAIETRSEILNDYADFKSKTIPDAKRLAALRGFVVGALTSAVIFKFLIWMGR
jgi:hypothetical protein